MPALIGPNKYTVGSPGKLLQFETDFECVSGNFFPNALSDWRRVADYPVAGHASQMDSQKRLIETIQFPMLL